MKIFKDFLIPDIENTFINLNEFADYHEINDEIKKCVVDDDVFEERASNQTTVLENGVYIVRKSIFIKKSDLEYRPEIQEPLKLDDVNYLVENVKEAENLYEIVITRNEY